jgi:hypothetical protein
MFMSDQWYDPNAKIRTSEEFTADYPHLTKEEADWCAQNAAIGNVVPIPRAGIGTGHGHTCFGARCVCHELGEDKDSY